MSLTLGQVKTAANPTSGSSITVNVVVNGNTIRNSTHTSSFVLCDTFNEEDENTITVTWTHNGGGPSVGYSASSHTKGHAVCGHISTTKATCSGTITVATSPQTCNLDFNLPINAGEPKGTPFYMEQLHKLDQNTTRVVYDPLNRA